MISVSEKEAVMTKCTIQTDDGLFHDFTISNEGPGIVDHPLMFIEVVTEKGKFFFNPDHVVSVECQREGA